MSAFEISVIVAEAQGQQDLQPTLASVERATAGQCAEVLVVRPPGRPPLPSFSTLAIRELPADEGSLVPQRWGIGVRAAAAPVFACLTSEFTVHPDWARTLLGSIATGAVGTAGAIELAASAGTTAAAVYLVRFSSYLPCPGSAPRSVRDIPGDTAAYQRDAVAAFPDLLAEGFWEVDFHRRFTAEGRQLVYLPTPLATFRPRRGLRASLVLRYRHGREFGITRVEKYRHSAGRLILGMPLVPVVLVARIVRRAATAGRIGLALRAFPVLAMISAAWAGGEAAGAWSARKER